MHHILWSFSVVVYRVGILYIANSWNSTRQVFIGIFNPFFLVFYSFVVDALIFKGLYCAGHRRCIGNAILILIKNFLGVLWVFFFVTSNLLCLTFTPFRQSILVVLSFLIKLFLGLTNFNVKFIAFLHCNSCWRHTFMWLIRILSVTI